MSIVKDEKTQANNQVAEAQHAALGNAEKTPQSYTPQEHKDSLWFKDAGLGLFMHWGISSVFGNVDLSWGMMQNTPWDAALKGSNKVLADRYYKEGAAKFTTANYDPDKWIKAASEAGFKYAVLTTKHHDGYALWPSKFGKMGTKYCLDGKDLLKPYVEACRKYGLKVGFYFSPPDWHHFYEDMSFEYGKVWWLRDPSEEKLIEYRKLVKGQLTELLTNYGEIDIIWFDGRGNELGDVDPLTIDEIRALQPHILCNGRMHGTGDFDTPECKLPEKPIEGRWEYCDNLGGTNNWGYMDLPYKPTNWVLSNLAKCRAWGGNMLANVGPMCDGQMPEDYYNRMKELSDWMKLHKNAVYDTEGNIYPDSANVPVTVKDGVTYAWLTDDNNEIVIKNMSKPEKCTLMAKGKEVPFKYENNTIIINVDKEDRSVLVDIIAII